MRKMLILSALALLTIASTGCCNRCRNLFRRGAPCGGTTLAAPPMLGGAIPLGNPMALPRMVPQNVIAQPNCCPQDCCQPAMPMCQPCCPQDCPSDCVPCDGVSGGYLGAGGSDCGCPTNPGEYFGGYVGDSAPPMMEGAVVPGNPVVPQQGSGSRYNDPRPVTGSNP